MNKTELVRATADHSGVSRDVAERVLNGLTDTILAAVKRQEDVKITGFGNFVYLRQPQRQGRNPKTGDPVTIAERGTVKFRASDAAKAYLNRR